MQGPASSGDLRRASATVPRAEAPASSREVGISGRESYKPDGKGLGSLKADLEHITQSQPMAKGCRYRPKAGQGRKSSAQGGLRRTKPEQVL